MHNLIQKNKKVHVLLVGDGPDKELITNYTKKYQLEKYVSILGDRSDIPEILAIADVFILPTLYEGMSNALLEAMTAGNAIITTDIPENRELVRHEESAILIPTKDVNTLTLAIEDFMVDKTKRTQIGVKAREAVKKFDIQLTAKLISDFLKKLPRKSSN